MAGRDALTTTDRKAALRRQTIHPLESRQRFAPAAMDRLGPLPHARRLATRPRPLPDAEKFGGEVSFRSLPLWSVYSITSSARASSVDGTSRPMVLAVFVLITSSYLVGACTGRSAGFSPLRMRST